VISSYQQQTREEIVKKIITANESILESAEAKVKELNAVEPYHLFLTLDLLSMSKRIQQ
jgi:hypothetical protein